MKLKEYTKNNVTVLELSGKILEVSDAKMFREKIAECIEAGQKHFVVDLQQVQIVNSQGLGMLVGAHISAMRAEGRLVLANVDNIRDLIVMTRLTLIFDIYDSVDEAVESFQVGVN